MTRVAVYARYSSEGQREASIDDQYRTANGTRSEKAGGSSTWQDPLPAHSWASSDLIDRNGVRNDFRRRGSSRDDPESVEK